MFPNGPAVLDRAPVQSSGNERLEVERFERSLVGLPSDQEAVLLGPGGVVTRIPPSVYRVLMHVVHHMARGDAISIVPYHQQVTTQEAAEILNMSRPSLIRILDQGGIAFTKTGTHRRLLLQDVLAYQEARHKERLATLDDLTRMSDELSLY